MNQTAIQERKPEAAQEQTKQIALQNGLSVEDIYRRHSGDDDGQHPRRRLEADFPVPTD